jgi:hypothetical protein
MIPHPKEVGTILFGHSAFDHGTFNLVCVHLLKRHTGAAIHKIEGGDKIAQTQLVELADNEIFVGAKVDINESWSIKVAFLIAQSL